MKQLALVVVLLAATSLVAQSSDLTGRVAFVSLTTVQDTLPDSPQKFAPDVLVRFTKVGEKASFLALTSRDGVAFLPIEAGRYCASAYGLNGRVVQLSPRSIQSQHRCFTAAPGKAVEFSLTLAAQAKYGGKVPNLGVN